MSSAMDDLQWQAMQYVLGEMSDTERDLFEARLADDLAACEAVTSASRLVLTAQAALHETSRTSPPRTAMPVAVHASRRAAWFAVAMTAAAGILCVVALQFAVSVPASRVAGQDSAELVALWRSGMAVDAADVYDPDDAADAVSDAVPSWMLAAVSVEAAAMDGQPEKIQEN
ncbi:MAG: hypothetical protein JSS49_15455 [Planctomycetes bacterium]|nr:hypothetical protein [Planctomycetota bacterium]